MKELDLTQGSVPKEMCIRDRSDDVCFLNTPHALLRALDKKETKQVLMDRGLKVTPMLPSPRSFDELRELLTRCV